MALSSEVFSWKDFLNDFNTLSKLMADQKNLSYKFIVDGIDDVFIKSDPVRIRQILWNTIANAIKFTKQGSVEIIVKNEVKANKLKTIISIKDSGIGIAKNEREKIFDMYYQVKGTKQATGTGIGLHVTKVLCDLFGAKIDLQSELGKGSIFSYTFDFDIASDNKNAEEIKSEKLNVLIVEDIDVNIIVTKGLLGKLGHSVMVAKTGKDTLELFKNNKFDVILLDMQLPDMHGLEIADVLYSEYNNETPIIAVTANVITDNNTYKEHHITSVINKPISLSKISEALNDIVKER
jgi:two-component system aerobic respiration control sensor histidine kinase ArcB